MAVPMIDERADKLVTVALETLQPLADSGDNMARHWIAVKRGLRSPGGRKAIADQVALARIAALEAAGRSREAVAIVARQMATDPKEIEAIERRLRRKRRIKTDTTGFVRSDF